ncbi:unnamed protein product [Mesocestoides corti]|uniref:Uncharacterized protein n=1 Tax=Mesocestoides corti TaxID=53468 RepID=A0A158QSJ3_MESCO|nr:unnamed protein product [Mesocestoides corti]
METLFVPRDDLCNPMGTGDPKCTPDDLLTRGGINLGSMGAGYSHLYFASVVDTLYFEQLEAVQLQARSEHALLWHVCNIQRLHRCVKPIHNLHKALTGRTVESSVTHDASEFRLDHTIWRKGVYEELGTPDMRLQQQRTMLTNDCGGLRRLVLELAWPEMPKNNSPSGTHASVTWRHLEEPSKVLAPPLVFVQHQLTTTPGSELRSQRVTLEKDTRI